jgi:hypothetical protein
MALKTRYGFWIEPHQLAGLRLVKARDGVLESEQIRRAIDAWLAAKGVALPKKPALRPSAGAATPRRQTPKRQTTSSRTQRMRRHP